jgi:hypothetical protein
LIGRRADVTATIMAKRRGPDDDEKGPRQLPLPLDEAPPRRPGRKAAAAEAGKQPALRVLSGGGQGHGHALGRLVAVGGKAPVQLPSRGDLDRLLLGALADLLAGRISPAAAAAIRHAAEETLRALDLAEADPDRLPELVRAARALRELVGFP